MLGDVQNAVIVYSRSLGSSGNSVVRAMSLSLPNTIETIVTATSPNRVSNVSISPRSVRLNSQNQLQFLIAWNQRLDSSLPWDVAYTSIESDSTTEIGSARVISNTFELGPPSVSDYGVYQGRSRAGITYTSLSPTTGEDVLLAIIEDGATPRISPVTSMEGLDSDHKQWSPVVAAIGEHFALAYLQSDPSTPGSRDQLYWTSGGLAGGGTIGLAERRQYVSSNSIDAANPSLALRDLGSTTNPGEGLLAWTSRGNVFGARVQRMDVMVAGWQYCSATNNSAGHPGWMRVIGRPSPTAPTLRLEAYQLPTGSFGYFLCSRGLGFTTFVGGSSGHLCLSGSHFGRFAANIQQTTSHGRLVTIADPRALPQAMGAIAVQSGETWCFQAWHRDSNHGNATSNLSNAVAVTFD